MPIVTLAATMAAVTSLKLRDIWLCKQCVCRSAILPHPFTQANINTGQKLAKTSKSDMKRTMSLSIQIRSCQIESDHSSLLTCTNKKYKKYEDDDVNISIKEAESNFGQLMVLQPRTIDGVLGAIARSLGQFC